MVFSQSHSHPRKISIKRYCLLMLFLLLPICCSLSLAGEKIFVLQNCSRDLETFRPLAHQAARLNNYGQVMVNVAALADRTWYEVPEFRSPWHQYTCHISAPWKFYPHPKIAKHIPDDWAAKNRKLLENKAAICRDLGVDAFFEGRFSHFLPASFFHEYPGLRGPRVDHPRRSNRQEFSLCTDIPETNEMISWMTAEMVCNVPEIKLLWTGANDAGSGLCWAEALYTGKNGPAHCSHINAGERIRNLCNTIQEGAQQGGGDMSVVFAHANLWRNERDVVSPLLPEKSYLYEGDPRFISLSTMISRAWPVKGLINPVELIEAMERYNDPEVEFVLFSPLGAYYRDDDNPETVSKMIETAIDCIEQPAVGLKQRQEKLYKLSMRWGGEEHVDRLYEAFSLIDQAISDIAASTPYYAGYNAINCAVSMRHLTRPLLIKPDLLTPEEESFFLPHIFNPNENEARMDYIDYHGTRMVGTPLFNHPPLKNAFKKVIEAASLLEGAEGAPEQAWLTRMAISIRMYVSIFRSIHNFYHGQLIREKFAEVLAGEPRIPPKFDTWVGDPEYEEWYAILRDELDNTSEMIRLLESGGLQLMALAPDEQWEDSFYMGPDLLDEVKMKLKLMERHWLDAQSYLFSPQK